MGKTEKPADLPSTNDLDGVHDPDAVDTGGVYIGLSATNIKLEENLEIDDSGLLMIKYVVIADGRKKMADGELRDRRTLKVIAAWVPNNKPVGQDKNQPGLYEIDIVDGRPLDSGDDDDEVDAEVVEDDDSVDTGVESPAFSDGKSAAAGSDE